MSSRIEKPYSQKSNEYNTLKAFIALNGRDVEMLCMYYFENKKECRFIDGKSWCEYCVYRAYAYDRVLVASSRKFSWCFFFLYGY